MGNPATWQTISQVLVAIGIVLTGLGGYGSYHFGKQLETAKAREVFLSSLHFHRLEGYWVEVSSDVYRLGLAATILNKDGNRAVVFNDVRFKGGFTLSGGSGSAHIQEIKFYDAAAMNPGKYFLHPASEEVIRTLLPAEVRMKISGGVPGLELHGTWTFMFEDTPFEVYPPSVLMRDVVTLNDWTLTSAKP